MAVPAGWEELAFFDRLIAAGVCGYESLVRPGLAARDVYDMHRLLDLREYFRRKAAPADEKDGSRELDAEECFFLFGDEAADGPFSPIN